MKKTLSVLLLSGAFFCSFCTNKLIEPEGVVIQMNRSATSLKTSDILKLEGFTLLESNSQVDLRGVSKVLFKEGKIVTLNQVGDKQDIWGFEEGSGKFLNRIGAQNNTADGYEGLNDIAFDGDELRCSVGGKLSFMNYDLNGNLRSSTPSGVFGEELEPASNHEFVVYNEYNATDISGLNHLLFYDKNGNVTKKAYPYLKVQDNNGFAFAGSLTSSNGLWFNPPFCDTIFELVQLGDIFPKDQASFALMLRPSRVKYLLEKNLLDLDGLNAHYPELANALKTSGAKEAPLMLYLTFAGKGTWSSTP